MHVVVEVAAWSAAAALLVAYALLSRGRMSGQGTSYQTINAVGSAVVGLNSLAHGAWPSFGINAIWAVIGVLTLAAAARRHLRARAATDGDAPGAHGDTPRARSDAPGARTARSDTPGARGHMPSTRRDGPVARGDGGGHAAPAIL